MSAILISPTEPSELKRSGKVSSVPERWGCDILVTANKRKLGIQRKKFPEDLLASLSDKRLYEQVQRMSDLNLKVVVLEGKAKWTEDGELIGDYQKFSKSQLWGLTFSLMFEFGIPVMRTSNLHQTVELVRAAERWLAKEHHTSLLTRGGAERNTWGVATNRSWQRHILQGFKGIGPLTADKIIDHFGQVPLRWAVEAEELMKVPGLGKTRVQEMMEALE